MSQEFKTFLAANVLNDGKIVGPKSEHLMAMPLADVVVPGVLPISGSRIQSA